MSEPIKPHLRPLDFQPVYHQNEQMWLLRDPWQLSERQLIFPQALAQMLLFCDGTRTVEEIHQALCEHLSDEVPLEAVVEAIAQLDQTFLLQSERFEREKQHLIDEYRSQSYRPPALAGVNYPEAPDELDALFRQYSNGIETPGSSAWRGRGLVSPHIDYQRGGPVYAQVWRRGARAVLDADLVLIFGTDHNGRPGSITLTHLPYATPYGVLPADTALVDRLAEAIGPEAAFREELNHRNEHSVELSAVWLHHLYHEAGVQPAPMVPVLVGSFHHFLENGAHPSGDATYSRFLAALREGTQARRILVVGSVDLAHVGPAFGDTFAMDKGRRETLRLQDAKLMATIIEGNAAAFYQQIESVRDRNRICGFAPLYLMLEYLQPTGGIKVVYEHCPADVANTSLVSVCGLLLN